MTAPRRISIKVGEDGWAIWANGHGHDRDRFLRAAARRLFRVYWSAYGGVLVKNMTPEQRSERQGYIDKMIIRMAPGVRERYMSRSYGGYDDGYRYWYHELHDEPRKGRWPVTVWEEDDR